MNFRRVCGLIVGFITFGYGQIPTLHVIEKKMIPLSLGSSSRTIVEPSAGVWVGQDLWFVSDGPFDNAIYSLKSGHTFADVVIPLETTEGFKSYLTQDVATAQVQLLAKKESKLRSQQAENGEVDEALAQKELLAYKEDKLPSIDFEGMAVCGTTLYLINERYRHVVMLSTAQPSFALLPITFPKEAYEGGINAGFEGVAADCEHHTLYVAKEREPRSIFVINLDTNTVTDTLTVPSQTPVAVHNPKGKPYDVSPDFSDLAFDRGLLFVLERNARRITVVDPQDKSVLAYLDYADVLESTFSNPQGLYETGEPYGIAEGLAMKGRQITLILDNNASILSPSAQQKYKRELKGFPVQASLALTFEVDSRHFKTILSDKNHEALRKKLSFLVH